MAISPVTIERAETSFREVQAKGNQSGFVVQHRVLGLSQARRILIVAMLMLVVGLILVGVGVYLEPDSKPIRGYTSMLVGFALTLASIWCVIHSLRIRRELADFLDQLIDSSREAAAVRELRVRARRLRRNAQFSLVMILVALAAGLVFFVYAGSITSLDREAAIRYEIELEKQRYELRQREFGKDYSPSSLIGELQGRIQKLEEGEARLSAANSPQVKSASDQRFTQQMVTATTTRLGSIIILLFLVQILVTLYRYNVRAAAFYDGRADALVMARKEDKELSSLVDLFTPTSIDFGKMPTTPLHSVLETARDALGKTHIK